MPEVELYTKPTCGFCQAAKRLLAQKGVGYQETDIAANPDKRPEMIRRAKGGSTVPQIFIGGTHIGGCDELFALEDRGALDGLLGR